MKETVTRHLRITGRVQGVGYRASLMGVAVQLGLKGWVRNCRDGSVEALLAGSADVVSAMIAAFRRGPSMARVDAVQEDDGHPDALKLRRAVERFTVLPMI